MLIREYVDQQGRSPFEAWFNRLPAEAAAKVRTAIIRLEADNLSNVEGVGEGVLERKINWGPGYRIYFAGDGYELIILLGGGSKKGQEDDIKRAKECWRDYRRRKKAKE
jgi:putative addiction module killer protein